MQEQDLIAAGGVDLSKQTWTDYIDTELPQGAQGIVRTAALLRIIASHNDDGLRLKDVLEIASLEQSTAHRVLTALDAVGFVTRHPKTRRYHLGPLINELYAAGYREFSLRDALLPVMKKLATQLGDTVYLAIRSGLDAICTERVDGSSPIRTCTVDVGVRRPLGIGATGIALLASFSEVERELIIRQNAERFLDYRTNEAEVRQRCAFLVENGYFHGPTLSHAGILSTSVAIKGYSGRPIVGLSTSGLATDDGGKHLENTVAALRGVSEDLISKDGPLSNFP